VCDESMARNDLYQLILPVKSKEKMYTYKSNHTVVTDGHIAV